MGRLWYWLDLVILLLIGVVRLSKCTGLFPLAPSFSLNFRVPPCCHLVFLHSAPGTQVSAGFTTQIEKQEGFYDKGSNVVLIRDEKQFVQQVILCSGPLWELFPAFLTLVDTFFRSSIPTSCGW